MLFPSCANTYLTILVYWLTHSWKWIWSNITSKKLHLISRIRNLLTKTNFAKIFNKHVLKSTKEISAHHCFLLSELRLYKPIIQGEYFLKKLFLTIKIWDYNQKKPTNK